MAYEEIKSSGIRESTPENILFGAGTIHKGLKFEGSKWNFAESLIGATQGGSKLSIVPEVTNIEADGALVKIKGLAKKIGETATMEINLLELTPEILADVTIGNISSSSEFTGYSEITSKANIEAGDYVENIAFVGKKLNGTPIVVILPNALCTTGLDLEGKDKENGVLKATFECYADLTGNHETLPWKILYPTQVSG